MVKLWGRADSINVQKVSWTLNELGVEHTRVDVGGKFGGLDDPDFLAKNPNGMIPVLEDGDLTVWESNAIVRHLVRTRGQGSLWPDDITSQALIDQWLEWQTTSFWPPIRVVFLQQFRTPEDQRDPDLIAQGFQDGAKQLDLLDRHLADTPYVVGVKFTVADVVLGAVVNRYTILHDAPALPGHVQTWFEELKGRAAFKETFA